MREDVRQRCVRGVVVETSRRRVGAHSYPPCVLPLPPLQLKLIDGLIAQEAKRRDELVAQLRLFQQKDGLKADENEFGATLEKILSTVPPSDCYEQTTHTTWNDMTKRLSQNLFREQSQFLAQMKAEKKKKLAEKAE